ncbi:MAG: hypothetical protein KBT20_01170 [Bacteroidales bacterium]|nr:hypothetical protein [Candidatus Liminaster caballi]
MNRQILLLILVVMTSYLLPSCGGGSAAYEQSVNVSLRTWSRTDTLSFEVTVPDVFDPYNPLQAGTPYNVALALRYRPDYPCEPLSLHMRLVNDSVSYVGCSRRLSLTGSDGLPDGSTWGSLSTKQFDDLQYTITFPAAGSYRLLIWPEHEASRIASVTVSLFK